jgi:hypothetical protein
MPTMFKPPVCSHPRSRQPVSPVSYSSTGVEQRPVYSHPVLQRVTRQPALPGRHPHTCLALTVNRSGEPVDSVNRRSRHHYRSRQPVSLQLPIGLRKVQGQIPVIRPCLFPPQSPSPYPVNRSPHQSPHHIRPSPSPLSTGVVNARPRWTMSTLGSPPAIHTPIMAAYLPLPAAL